MLMYEPPPSFNELFIQSGIGFYRFGKNQLSKINLETSVPANDTLVGAIDSEYMLKDTNKIDDMVTPVVYEYMNYNPEHVNVMKKFGDYPLQLPVLGDVWINRQKKHEFNPLHDHTGVFSFVIWYDIPYTNEEEAIASPFKSNKLGQLNTSGNVAFITENPISPTIRVLVDKSWNGTMAIFPARFMHCVYPFYSTDEERVTIAGNYYYNL